MEIDPMMQVLLLLFEYQMLHKLGQQLLDDEKEINFQIYERKQFRLLINYPIEMQ